MLCCVCAVIIGREIAMSALRELAASLGGEAYSAVAVSAWGKWKTATQARWSLTAVTSEVACKLLTYLAGVKACCR
jgi:phosphatidylglycerophosphate synthase